MYEAKTSFKATPCVYIQADADSRPIRVGKASKGIEARYRGGTAYALDAAMHDSGNLVYVAPTDECIAVESELIWQLRDRLTYNNQGKKTAP
jgi:hypothetical protein